MENKNGPRKSFDDNVFIPWGLHPVKSWVVSELQERGQDYGLKNKEDAAGTKRNGIRTPWVRFFSNGVSEGDASSGLDGFLMGGVYGFNKSYGFDKTPGEVVLGLDANGKEHVVYAVESFPNRPPPTIESIDVEQVSGQSAPFSGMCRKVTVKWKAFSLDHLRYLTPYFLSPKVTAVVEWGWDNYNPASLLSYDVNSLKKTFKDPTVIMNSIYKSNGNYDASIGYITDYNYKISGMGVYECSTTITTVAWLFEGQDYGNQTLKRVGKNGRDEKIESFKEFNKYSRWDNLGGWFGDADDGKPKEAQKPQPEIPRPASYMPTYATNRYGGIGMYSNQSYPKPPPPEDSYPYSYGRVFQQQRTFGRNKKWIRMDYFVELLNHFFTIELGDTYVTVGEEKDNKVKKFEWCKINIDKTLICAHPGLKSIDPEIIVPNKFAPKYILEETKAKQVAKGKTLNSSGELQKIKIEGVNYFDKFKKVAKVLQENKFSADFDDLFELVSEGVKDKQYKGHSFPIFSESELEEQYKKNVGYAGYLKDLYISTEFIKRSVEESATVKGMLTSILNKISGALSGIVELKIYPNNEDNTEITVIDTKFCPVLTKEDIDKLTKIIPGSIKHSYLLSADVDIKLSPEMANQVLFTAGSKELKEREDAEKKKAENKDKKEENRGTQIVSDADSFGKFVANDRLAEKAKVAASTTSTSQENPKTKKLTRNTNDEGFNIITVDTNGKKVDYYTCEPSQTLMRQVVMEDEAPGAVYANTAIMPNTKFNFETLGIGGFTFLGMFTLDHVPYAYTYNNAVWQISSIKQTVVQGSWKTSISAEVRKITTFTG